MFKVSPRKFYKLFLREFKKSDIASFWYNNKKWTKRLLEDKDCLMRKIANRLGLLYWNEYFSLDGIFFQKELKYENVSYAENIEVIVESENDYRTIGKEVYKLIPLFVAPLKVIITYFGGDFIRNQKKIEEISRTITTRIETDDPFGLHRNKIKLLLIIGFYTGKKINWQAFIYYNKRFKAI